MLTETQIQERRNYVTGTDASCIMGVNPYESIIDVWKSKLGLSVPKDLSQNPRVKAGNYLEPIVCNMFSDETKKQVLKPEGIIIHKTIPHMAGNLDGIIKDEPAILEIKTAGFEHGWGLQGENIIPKHYLCQVAHYLAVTDAQYAYVAVLIAGWDFRYYVVDRSEKFETLLIEREKEFWEYNVKQEICPEARTLDDVVDMYRNKISGSKIKAHPGIMLAVEKVNNARKEMSRLDKLEKHAKTEIALYMREHEVLVDENDLPVATFKYNKDSKQFNKEAFERTHPDIFSQFETVRPGARVMKIKEKEHA